MAKIVEITVEGLGGGNKVLRKSLDPHINVFFGKNGGGKTTLLRTLHSALRNEAKIISDTTVKTAAIEIESLTFKKNFRRVLTRTSEVKSSQLSLSGVDVAEAGRPEKKPTLVWQTEGDVRELAGEFQSVYLSVSRLYTEALRQAGRNYILSTWQSSGVSDEDPAARELTLEAMFVGSFTRKWSLYSNRLLAEITRMQQDGIGSILQAVLLTNRESQPAPQGDPDKAYEIAKSFFQRQPELNSLVKSKTQFKSHYGSNPSLRAVMRNIEVVEQNIEEALRQRTSLSDTLNKLFGGKKVRLTDTGVEIESSDGTVLNMTQLSTGEKQLLSLCVEILAIEGPGTLIIDEPEMSLHVDWQRDLLGTLTALNPAAQIIVATHSPEIMANIDDRCIFRV